MVSPRLGFRWFTDDAHNTLIRGGIGVFTGRVPFVWLSNAFGNNGVEQIGTSITSAADIPAVTANTQELVESLNKGSKYRMDIATVDKNFRFPQVMRANLALEQKFAGWKFTLEGLYKRAYEAALEEAAFSQQLMAGIVNHLIGLMYSLDRNRQLSRNQQQVDMISRARMRIRESLESDLTIQQIAEELGVSYSNLRKLFKEHTGLSPATYQQELHLLRAKELLTTTQLSIKEIAYRLNFESPDYFSAKFKAKMGLKPSEVR